MLSTHIMQEVEAICDRVIIINHGMIVANDESKNLRSGATAQVIRVEFDNAVAANLLQGINGISEVKKVSDNMWLLGSSSEIDIRPKIFEFAVAQSLSVLTIQKEEQRLEDVFKELTK